jgi:alkylhydroperoxidase family enzyme
VTLDRSPLGLATLYADIGRELSLSGSRTDALGAVARVALAGVPGVEWASITEGVNGRFSTVAFTDERARAADAIQYELGTGPCVDAILKDTVFRTGDLGQDGRWPEFARRARDQYGVRSMLSFRLYIEDDPRIAGLNLYSTRADAVDDTAETVGTLVAAHGALAITAATAREQTAQLQTALVNSREIGMAMGVIMATYKVTREQAFDLLRISSQNSNRKLADIATAVVDTGVLDLPRDRVATLIGGRPGPLPQPRGSRPDVVPTRHSAEAEPE